MQSSVRLLFTCLFLLCLIGCIPSDSTPPVASAEVDVMEDAPASKTFHYESARPLETAVFTDAEFITAARKVLVQDEFVIVGDSRGDSLIRVFDSSGKHLGSLGRNGRGPGEFMTVWWMVESRPPNTGIWFFDIGNQRLTHHDFKNYPEHIADDAPHAIQLKHEGMIANIAWLDEQTFLGSGRLAGGRFVRFDTAGNAGNAVGALPTFRTEVPMSIRQQAYTGYMYRHPTDSLLVEGTRFSDRLTIYNFDGEVLHVARTADPFEPDGYMRILMDEKPASGEELVARYGFLDVTANADVIYALFSGRSDNTSNYSRLVFAFDWAGNFLEAYQLDTDVISITVDPSGNSLFAVRHNPSPAIVQVDL